MPESIQSTKHSVVYIASSQYSGSTLASFMLNMHPNLATVGHTTGWNFPSDEDFRCSCGIPLGECEFYNNISNEYAKESLKFDIRNFGTEYRLVENNRTNRYLTASLPLVANTILERVRDDLVSRIPKFSRKFSRQQQTNVAFMRAVMRYSGANVYVDNSHDPYRLRHLSKNASLEVKAVHLVRDPRGVTLSCMKHANWSASVSIRAWLRRQSDIQRIVSDLNMPSMLVYYEDLCTDADGSLARIHEYAGQNPEPFKGDFSLKEHHILGNAMRLRSGQIRLDEKWLTDLSNAELNTINDSMKRFVDRKNEQPTSTIVQHYLESP